MLKNLVLLGLLVSGGAHASLPDWMGKQRAAVVLLEWADQPTTLTAADAQDAFFTEGVSSIRQFFNENSLGKFDFSGKIFNWNRSKLNWDPKKGCDPNFIANEAWNVFQRAVEIPKFDSDGNGKIDHLFVIHSGRIPQDRVGPDCVFGNFKLADNTVVFQSEGLGSVGQGIPIGFYLHESGHNYFSFPDLYDDHYHGHYGIGMWGMMGLGAWGVNNNIPKELLFRVPSHFEPASKVRIGWVQPNVVKVSQAKVRLRPVETSGDVVAIPLKGGDNFYLEYRSPYGFSKDHLGHGLLIWRNFDLIQADGRNDLDHGHNLGYRPLPPIAENFGDASDPFPGSLGITKFEDAASKLKITNVAQTAEYVEFDVELPVTNAAVEFKPSRGYWDGQERL